MTFADLFDDNDNDDGGLMLILFNIYVYSSVFLVSFWFESW